MDTGLVSTIPRRQPYLSDEYDPFENYVTAAEAARIKGVHINSVYKAAASSRIRHRRFGERWFIHRGDLDRWELVGNKPKGYRHPPKTPKPEE
jgi:excisionase family DNA binding protein